MFNMKKTLTPVWAFGFLTAILLLTFSACKKDAAAGRIDITGKWTKTEFQGVTQYEFKSDHTVEFTVMATDSVTKKLIGYRYKSIGKFSVEGSELKMYDLTNFSNSKNSFGPAEELVPIDGPKTAIYTISLNSDKNKLSLYFTCPPNANCVPSPIVYFKLE
jgi:hypothetical protein